MKNILAIALFAASVGTPCNPRPQPTPRPTLPPISTPTAAPTQSIPTPIPPLVQTFQCTDCEAVWRFDLTGFQPRPRVDEQGNPLPAKQLLDYYAGVTACWDPSDLHAPCAEISVRGYDPDPCMVEPCASETRKDKYPIGPHPLGIVLRTSGDVAHDGTGIPEHDMCGSGINYTKRLPLGAYPIVDVKLEWSPSLGWKISTPAASRTLKQGAPRVGLGWWDPGVGKPPKGIGWARTPWTLQDQEHPGSVSLISWRSKSGAQPELQECPAH